MIGLMNSKVVLRTLILAKWRNESCFRGLTDIGAITVKGHWKVAQKRAHAYKGPLQKGALLRGALTDKEPSQTRSSYRQGPLQTKDPYRRCVIPTDKGPYRQFEVPIKN